MLNLEASQNSASVIENKDNPARSKSASSDANANKIYHITNKSPNTMSFRRTLIRLPEPALPHPGNTDTGKYAGVTAQSNTTANSRILVLHKILTGTASDSRYLVSPPQYACL
jgi:hypothetical protein